MRDLHAHPATVWYTAARTLLPMAEVPMRHTEGGKNSHTVPIDASWALLAATVSEQVHSLIRAEMH